MLKNQIKRTRLMGVAIILVAGILIWVPDIVFSRLHFSTEVVQGKMEGRALIYTSAVEHLPEYVTTGVGAGNFWGWWGYYSGFSRGFPHAVVGAHNCFIQVTIYWGLAGLLALIMVVWQAYRCLPKRCRDDGLALCLLGVSISLLLLMLVMHNLYGKDFALGLGLLVAARRWVWPTGIVESASPE